MATIAPYGTWRSPITVVSLTESAVTLEYPSAGGGRRYWVEGRPDEEGRSVVVAAGPSGEVHDLFGPGWSARTLVHEYGGRSYTPVGDSVVFANLADQRLYRVDPGAEPVAVTPEPASPGSVRFAVPTATPDGRWVLCVRERHEAGTVLNDLVAVAVDGSRPPVLLAGGHDFYTSPAVSPDGARIAFISWDHPQMPWDGTDLWEAEWDGSALGEPRHVAGSPTESVTQARYAPDGRLHFISDRTGWWNLYAQGDGGPEARYPAAAEFADPEWQLGEASYAFVDDGAVVMAWSEGGEGRLGVLAGPTMHRLHTPFSSYGELWPVTGGVLAVAGAPTAAPCVVSVAVADGATGVLARSRPTVVDAAYLSLPEPIEFPTEDGLTAHALFYPPANADVTGPDGERPPLVVMSHGGPTSAASGVLNYRIQFWTSRGFAVADVDYGGSTGYGRAYRERLKGRWGVVDLNDCVNAARHLAAVGRVDGDRMVIRGGSAGGYTTLCALTFSDAFAGGASLFGVGDAGALARDTHKFESRYLDSMIGPWPEARELYEARSPLFHTDRMRTPIILLQGLDDRVVPPEQAETMVRALDEARVPHAYVAFPGEQHGFRRAENIRRASEAELYFYGVVLGFDPADELAPVPVAHAERLGSTR